MPTGIATSLFQVAVIVSSLFFAAVTFPALSVYTVYCCSSEFSLFCLTCGPSSSSPAYSFILFHPFHSVSLRSSFYLWFLPFTISVLHLLLHSAFLASKVSVLNFISFLSAFPSFLPQFPPSSVLSYPLVYTFFLTSVVISVLASTYYFPFTGSFYSLFSD